MVGISLQGVSKTFGESRLVLNRINLTVQPGNVLAIRGDNGSGKTTLLSIIAGLTRPTAGSAVLSDPAARIGYAPQEYSAALFPWLSVQENISLPLRLQNIGRATRIDRAREILATLGFSIPLDIPVTKLSGGQKQRVAIARALVANPSVLLLDEPFSNLDAHTSRDLQDSISRYHSATGVTICYVAHDLDQALFLADRIIILSGMPSSITHTVNVAVARPRSRSILLTEEFASVRREVIKLEETLYAGS